MRWPSSGHTLDQWPVVLAQLHPINPSSHIAQDPKIFCILAGFILVSFMSWSSQGLVLSRTDDSIISSYTQDPQDDQRVDI